MQIHLFKHTYTFADTHAHTYIYCTHTSSWWVLKCVSCMCASLPLSCPEVVPEHIPPDIC